jgi:ATP-dependent exoDNAse (exonuclease V) alpha subunit
VCETVHRSKGLEYDAVVLVVDKLDVSDLHLYVGASRAVSLLTVIGPAGLEERF